MAENNIFDAPNLYVNYFNNEPYVVIIEQPATNSHIFRYASEISVKEANGSEVKKRNAGSIVGVNSRPGNKTYPTIKAMDYQGPYMVVVSCVGKDGPPYRPHPHNLIGTKHCKDGVYRNLVKNTDMTHSLKNVAIERVKKNDINNSLRRRKALKIDPYLTGFDDSNIDLKCVRLCFQVFIPGPDDHFSRPLEPVVSDLIFDRKDISHLTIVQLSHFSASVTGGTKMILLCDHVDKNDIEVWFYEKRSERIVWENKAQFGINDVYKSVAISFKTPPYRNINIPSSVSVSVELRKPSENKRGEPRNFFFVPEESDSEGLANKRFKAGKMSDWWSVLSGYVEPERPFAIGVPRISGQSSHEMVRVIESFDAAAGPQLPVDIPRMSMQSSYEMARIDSTAGNQFTFVSKFNENYPLVSTPPVSIAGSYRTDPLTESCGAGTMISPTTHLQPAQPVGFAPSSSAHQQASADSHDATLIMQQIHETVNTETLDGEENSLLKQFHSMDLDIDTGVENLWQLSLSLFAEAQSFLDQSSPMDGSSSKEPQ